MTPTPKPVTVSAGSVTRTIDTILGDLLTATQVISATGVLIPGYGVAIAAGATIAAKIEAIIKGALDAHIAIMGKPLDLSLLTDEAPIK